MHTFAVWTQIIATLIAGIGLWLTAWQFHKSIVQRRLDQLSLVWEQLNQRRLKKAFSKIEYEKFDFCPQTFLETDLEHDIDALLSIMDYIATLEENKYQIIKHSEMMAYVFIIIYKNKEIKKYLEHLDELVNNHGISITPFGAFRRIGNSLSKQYGNR